MPGKIIGLRVALLVALPWMISACSNAEPVAAAAPQAATKAAAPPAAATQQTPRPTTPSATKAAAPAPQRASVTQPKPANDGLPPIQYICTMTGDEGVLEDKPGKCPKCGMELKPIRLAPVYSCLNNTAFISEAPGKCRTDGTEMVPITASLYWACPGSETKELNPGKCADGSARVKRYEARPHGDHNPRHGGTLFMDKDAWHHVEGTYPSAGLFRLFFYNDYTKPLDAKGITARVVMTDQLTSREIGAAVPLKQGRISNTMEAQIPNAKLPLSVKVYVRFKPNGPESAFDFPFPAYTKEPVAPVATMTQAGARDIAPSAQGRGAAPTQGRGAGPARGNAPATNQGRGAAPAPQPQDVGTLPPPMNALELGPPPPVEEAVPDNVKALLAEMTDKTKEVETLLQEGSTGQIWVPALRTKNLGVALFTDHVNEIPASQRPFAESAVNRLLRSAFLLDAFGDLGDTDKIRSVNTVFTQAVNDLKAAYATVR